MGTEASVEDLRCGDPSVGRPAVGSHCGAARIGSDRIIRSRRHPATPKLRASGIFGTIPALC
jgi:hypothetical protein